MFLFFFLEGPPALTATLTAAVVMVQVAPVISVQVTIPATIEEVGALLPASVASAILATLAS